MKQIKDPVHGYVSIEDPFFDELIDTELFQRMRNLKQLSATYMVYPSANHTRFEHTLGVFHLAKRAFESVKQTDGFSNGVEVDTVKNTLLCAALLHDIGHPPYSHVGEELLERDALISRLEDSDLKRRIDAAGIETPPGEDPLLKQQSPHELLSCVIALEVYNDALERLCGDPAEVAAYILGCSLKAGEDRGWQHEVVSDILSSSMDVDRLDYVKRDNFMTGADVANVDTERLVSSYTAYCDPESDEYELAFTDKALSTVRNYLDGRLALYKWVTQHHKSVYANALLERLLSRLDEHRADSLFTVERILEDAVDEGDVQAALREATEDDDGRLTELYDRFKRRHFKASCWKHRLGLENILGGARQVRSFEQVVRKNTDQFKRDIADSVGISHQELWVERADIPTYSPNDLSDVKIRHEGETKSVEEIGLYSGDDDRVSRTWYLYTEPEHSADVVEYVQQTFG